MCPKVCRFVTYAVVFSALLGSVVCQSSMSCVTPDNKPGSCVARNACSLVRDLMDRAPIPLSASDTQLFLDYRCDRRSKLPKVCCPNESGPLSVAGHRNLCLLPEECGGSEGEDRLYQGNTTNLYEFPFMALISYVENGYRSFQCAGSIINSRYILTAAHCLTNLGGRVVVGVRVGEHDYATADDCEMITKTKRVCAPPVQDFLIQKIITHASYVGAKAGGFRFRHDIGLIRLQGSIDLSQINAKPVCLPTTQELQLDELTQDLLVLPGWGVTETKKQGSTELLKIAVAIVSNEICGQRYNASIADGVSNVQMCAGGEKNVGSCGADSGGPLVQSKTVDNLLKLVQFGILSGGTNKCGRANSPGLYTRVAYYMDWILNQLEP